MKRNDTQQILRAVIVEVDVDRTRVRIQCPYHKGQRGHTHWVNLSSLTNADKILLRAACKAASEDCFYEIDLKVR